MHNDGKGKGPGKGSFPSTPVLFPAVESSAGPRLQAVAVELHSRRPDCCSNAMFGLVAVPGYLLPGFAPKKFF